MPRTLHIQYPGVIYHIMSRGDRRANIFLDDVDRQDFIKTLAETCQLAIAARLRRETTLTLKAIAARVALGSSKSANARLHRWMAQQGEGALANIRNLGI